MIIKWCMIRFVYLFILVTIGVNCFGQQKPLFTQYMFNGLAINPAYCGNQKMLSASVLYRKQWVNVPGGPNTQTFAFHSQLKHRAANMGLGLMVFRDAVGVHTAYDVMGIYAYRIQLTRKAILSMGLQAGFSNLNSDFSKLTLRQANDPLFISASQRTFKPNFGTGLYYYRSNLTYIGFSIPYLMKNKIVDIIDSLATDSKSKSIGRESRYYMLSGGFYVKLNENLKLKPSILLKMQEGDIVNGGRKFSPITMDLNANLIIKDMFAAGLTYRRGEGSSLLFQWQMTKNLQFGYAYDLTLSSLITRSRGSHEIMLNYRFNLSPDLCPVFH